MYNTLHFLKLYYDLKLIHKNNSQISVEDINTLNKQSNDEVDAWINSLQPTLYPAINDQLEIIEANNIQVELDSFYNKGILTDNLSSMLKKDLTSRMNNIFIQEIDMLLKDHHCEQKLNIETKNTILVTHFSDLLKFTRCYLLMKDRFYDWIYEPNKCPWTWNFVGGVKAHTRIIFLSLSQYISFCYTSLPYTSHSGNCPLEIKYIIKSGLMKSDGCVPYTYSPHDILLIKPQQIITLQTQSSTGCGLIDVGVGDMALLLSGNAVKLNTDPANPSGIQELKTELLGVCSCQTNKNDCIIL